MGWTKLSQVMSLLGVMLSTSAATVTTAEAQNFGKVGAVNQEATGTPPGGSTRKLSVGAGVVVKERVRTSALGSTQIQFPDQSAINLGANCDMVIDEFVYNPQAKTGTMAATVTRGALRYIGGQISHNSGTTIRTPTAGIGIRGGMVTLVVQLPASIAQQLQQLTAAGGTLVLANFGQITVSNNVGSVNLLPGFATVLGGSNNPIPTPFRLPDAVLQLITQLINSKPGQTGGVANIPTQGSVPDGYKFTIVADPTAPPGTDPLGYISIFGAGNSAGKGVSQTTQGGSITPPPPQAAPPPPPPPPPPPENNF